MKTMKNLFLLSLLAIVVCSCERSNGSGSSESCSYNGHRLHIGEKGGCYYLSSGGNKEYVDKSHCNDCY